MERIVESTVDHLYIEANATAEPALIRGFLEEAEFADQIFIERIITIVDASTFLYDFFSTDTLSERGLFVLPHDDRLVSEVLAEQVECADSIIITKDDLVSNADMSLLKGALSSLHPAATIAVFGTQRYDGYIGTIDTFTFTANRPFHPLRLHAALQTNAFHSVLRARGTAWIATRQEYRVRWSQTGSICSLESDGSWWVTGSTKQEEELNAQWFEACGNRYQNIEFIGLNMDSKKLQNLLHDCLLTELEMSLGADLWPYFDDPFDDWDHSMDRSLFFVPAGSPFLSLVHEKS